MVSSEKPDVILMSQAWGKSYRGGDIALLPSSKDNKHLFWCRCMRCYLVLINVCQSHAEWGSETSSPEGCIIPCSELSGEPQVHFTAACFPCALWDMGHFSGCLSFSSLKALVTKLLL